MPRLLAETMANNALATAGTAAWLTSAAQFIPNICTYLHNAHTHLFFAFLDSLLLFVLLMLQRSSPCNLYPYN